MSASLALAFTNNAVSSRSVVIIAILALASFLLLELRERSSMSFNKKDVIDIERIFMEKDQARYKALIGAYEFRDLRLSRLSRLRKLLHLIKSLKHWTVLLWYSFWLSALIVAFAVRPILECPTYQLLGLE
jgi:hypothetical protein